MCKLCLLFLLSFLPKLSFGTDLLRSASEITNYQRYGDTDSERPFVVTGRVNRVLHETPHEQSGLLLEDSSGIVDICVIRIPPPTVGDIIAVHGIACINPLREPWFKQVTFCKLGHDRPPEPLVMKIASLSPERHHLRLVATQGTVIDVQHDEIDVRFDRLDLKDNGALIPVSVLHSPANLSLLDTEIRVCGTYTRNSNGYRKFAGPQIEAFQTNAISILRRSGGPFDCPVLEESVYVTPQDLLKLGKRRITGTVLATWQKDHILVEHSLGRIATVRLAGHLPPPKVGSRVTVAGYPETDSFRINLTKARYRTESESPPADVRTPVLTLSQLFYGQGKGRTIISDRHGCLLQVCGRVILPRTNGDSAERIDLICNDLRVPIDTSNCPHAMDGLSAGCEVEVTGVCILEFDGWTPYDTLPRITGFAIVLRTADDLRIVARPPWWTPLRLGILVAALLLVLVIILIWNLMLKKLANRRGREMLRAQIGEIRSSLKTEERTRLAVELHDSLAQTLTGVSMEIATADRYGKANPDEMLRHHEIAVRALTSCRNELRNSLWDLRNQSLDGINVDEAIRRTLLPHLKGISLSVRFTVLRNRLSDNFLHEILRIIRELALNGIRHGNATAVRVAGGIDGERLNFSVRDNGTGFDAASAPGVTEGHFGLQGIRERLNRFAGTLSFSRTHDGWMKATVSMDLPATKQEEVY